MQGVSRLETKDSVAYMPWLVCNAVRTSTSLGRWCRTSKAKLMCMQQDQIVTVRSEGTTDSESLVSLAKHLRVLNQASVRGSRLRLLQPCDVLECRALPSTKP